jgi:hypothetical protein
MGVESRRGGAMFAGFVRVRRSVVVAAVGARATWFAGVVFVRAVSTRSTLFGPESRRWEWIVGLIMAAGMTLAFMATRPTFFGLVTW